MGPGEERGVCDDESSGEPEKEDRRHTTEEVSCSRIEEADVGDIPTEDEKVLWRSLERDGFPREEISEWGRPGDIPREEDIDTTPGVWATPPHPRRDIGGRIIPRGEVEFRRSLRAESPGTLEEG